MKINKKFLIPLVVLLTLVLGFWNLNLQNKKITIRNEKVVQKYQASLSIQSDSNKQSFDISPYIGKSALEATISVLNDNIKTNGTGTNAFVTSLNGKTADTKKHEFWELDANGTETQVGAGSYIIQNGDQIVWKISTY